MTRTDNLCYSRIILRSFSSIIHQRSLCLSCCSSPDPYPSIVTPFISTSIKSALQIRVVFCQSRCIMRRMTGVCFNSIDLDSHSSTWFEGREGRGGEGEEADISLIIHVKSFIENCRDGNRARGCERAGDELSKIYLCLDIGTLIHGKEKN